MKPSTHARLEQTGRRLVQTGFLLLFLFPLGVTLYQRVSYNSLPVLKSWLIMWDPALALVRVFQNHPLALVIGAPLFLIVLTFLLGRSFCGWVCPIGTLADLIRSLAFWQKPRSIRQSGQNSPVRYYLLAAIATASLVSLKFLGIFDPLVIFHRVGTAISINLFAARQPDDRTTLVIISLVFVAIVLLELWRPRLWCRALCPFGALLALFARFSLLRCKVDSTMCNGCRRCVRVCEMNALTKNGQINDYTHCNFCLKCGSACPTEAISFAFTLPAKNLLVDSSGSKLQKGSSPAPQLTRRNFLGLLGAGAVGLAAMPLIRLAPKTPVLRPPGALPEDLFVETCILCQECVRVCPTGGLRPATFESGLAGVGTPLLVPRQGGCSLNPSCASLCAQVCPVGAILPIDKTEMKIGRAVVHREACLAWDQGSKCLVCVEACLNNAAIAFNGRVTVDPNRCTGCGRCESGCPVPGSAIRVVPLS